MTYRIIIDGKVRATRRDVEEARNVAQIEALASGKIADIEEAEAGNKWTGVEMVFPNGSDVPTARTPQLRDTCFGSFDHEPPFFREEAPEPKGLLRARFQM